VLRLYAARGTPPPRASFRVRHAAIALLRRYAHCAPFAASITMDVFCAQLALRAASRSIVTAWRRRRQQ